MRVYRSNRMEELSKLLAGVLEQPCESGSALEAVTRREKVVVHSQGMARWLEMELARYLKISSNIEFPFPKSTILESVDAVLTGEKDAWKRWQPNALLWATLEALGGLLEDEAFKPLSDYLSGRHGTTDPLSTADGVLLAREIADVFDRYVTYRPDLVLGWSGHAVPDDWQGPLWRAVEARMTSGHLAKKGELLRQELRQGAVRPDKLPPRLCLFGISTMPPFFLDLFARIDQVCEVHLFVLCPSTTYWAHIRSKREIARELRRAEREGKETTIEALALEEGNPLLASFGRLGRDFQVVLEGGEVQSGYEDLESFPDPALQSRRMLHVLQSDILNLRHRGKGGGDGPPKLSFDDAGVADTSVRVHACYGAMRQVEALRDELVARLEDDETLQPRDIVVMTPDIERFAPLVEAVFADLESKPKIPVRIADRALGKENPVAEILVRVMAMTDGRLTGPELLDLLSLAPVQRRFGLRESDLPLLQEWVQKTGIRWGIDAEDRARVGQPGADGLNTWRFGLARMLLGVAMPGGDQQSFMGVLPYDEIEGGDAVTAGRLADACEALFSAITRLRASRRDDPTLKPPQTWVEILKGVVDALVDVPDGDAWRIQQVHEVLDELSAEATGAECERPVTFAAMRALLTRRLEKPRRASGFVTGAVTFCAMVPMRSVPFKVVVMLGMDEDAFPRKQRRVDFDKTFQRPRLGDRNPREEDRYLMLEALLAARDAMVIIYNGYDTQTGKERPPAAPVDELLEVLEQSFEGAVQRVVVRHPLHAFSPTLFGVATDPEHLGDTIPSISHDARLVPAAKRMLSNTVEVPPRFRGSVRAPAGLEEVSIHELTTFFEHPAKFFLNKRLGLYLPKDDEELDPREPMNAGNDLDKWKLRDGALRQRQTDKGAADEALYERAALTGGLPLGLPGRVEHEVLMGAIPAIFDRADPLIADRPERYIDVDLPIDGTRILGRIDGIRGDNGPRVVLSVSTSAPKYHLRLWLNHVVRRALEEGESRAASHLIARDGNTKASRLNLGEGMTPEDAQAYLKTLLRYYRIGQQAPLLFFPRTSYKYAAGRRAKPTKTWDVDVDDAAAVEALREKKALSSARATWDGDDKRLERDEHHLMLWGEQDPVDQAFTLGGVEPELFVSFHELAEAIWAPFLDEKVK